MQGRLKGGRKRGVGCVTVRDECAVGHPFLGRYTRRGRITDAHEILRQQSGSQINGIPCERAARLASIVRNAGPEQARLDSQTSGTSEFLFHKEAPSFAREYSCQATPRLREKYPRLSQK